MFIFEGWRLKDRVRLTMQTRHHAPISQERPMDASTVKDLKQSRSHTTPYASVFVQLRSSDDTRVAVNRGNPRCRSTHSRDNPKIRVF